MTLQRALAWIRANLEQTAVLSALTACAAFVANFYYGGFYSFYFIDSENIDTPLADKLWIFAIILVAAVALIALVARSEEGGDESIGAAFLDNVPFLILLILITVLVIDIYWSNVQSLSAWGAKLIKNAQLATVDEHATEELERYLRIGIVIVPAVAPPIVVGALSLRRYSFSRFILNRTRATRLGLLGAYIVLTLAMARAVGHFVGYLEFHGFIDPESAVVTLSDGTVIGRTARAFLLVESGSAYYVVTSAVTEDGRPKVWILPQGSVRQIALDEGSD